MPLHFLVIHYQLVVCFAMLNRPAAEAKRATVAATVLCNQRLVWWIILHRRFGKMDPTVALIQANKGSERAGGFVFG